MKVRPISSDQQSLLDRLEAVGGVVEFSFYESESEPPSVKDHRCAVISTFPYHDLIENVGRSIAEMIPKQISWEQFLGSRYDYSRQGLIVRGKGSYLNEFFFYLDPPKKPFIIPSSSIDGGVGDGFAYAFSSPPHGLSINRDSKGWWKSRLLKVDPYREIGELFETFLTSIICGSESSIIYEWPTDWSTYFDCGREWWGTFLWSLSQPNENRIVVIAASTTD